MVAEAVPGAGAIRRLSPGVHPGDKIDFVFSSDGQLVVKPRTIHVEQLFGLLHRKGEKALTLEQIEAGIAGGATKGER
jgi:hypothetical protein